ncbi:uncharacterized protein BDR25DRAFT_308592 [Lindgomyces ingoldianus]|uniref:Uncharacterized protein n=1 Tax=Lindgomyces ingoldianus TaxID=673940 RepID=A0ACB6RHA3_9PLEO|nr:uncharacterized protein BDR25DRAFT_308592 [Lindgomyces ingoldianus]KAF2477712.1 hypothetical protein BDR25DRAFT_308592 [Lindgomyces ingoldianus]
MKFKLLLDSAANLMPQSYEKQTCLQIAIRNVHFPKKLVKDMEAIVLLIQYGVDIFATDDPGRSIFDDAYECDHNDYLGLVVGTKVISGHCAITMRFQKFYLKEDEDINIKELFKPRIEGEDKEDKGDFSASETEEGEQGDEEEVSSSRVGEPDEEYGREMPKSESEEVCLTNSEQNLSDHAGGHPEGLLVSIEKARRRLGYEPLCSTDEGIWRTIEWF